MSPTRPYSSQSVPSSKDSTASCVCSTVRGTIGFSSPKLGSHDGAERHLRKIIKLGVKWVLWRRLTWDTILEQYMLTCTVRGNLQCMDQGRILPFESAHLRTSQRPGLSFLVWVTRGYGGGTSGGVAAITANAFSRLKSLSLAVFRRNLIVKHGHITLNYEDKHYT